MHIVRYRDNRFAQKETFKFFHKLQEVKEFVAKKKTAYLIILDNGKVITKDEFEKFIQNPLDNTGEVDFQENKEEIGSKKEV